MKSLTGRRGAFRFRAAIVALVLALCSALMPVAVGHASGVFWLPTQQATDSSFDHINPVVVAYHNHAYSLSVRVNGSSAVTSVFFSTNESGRWTTQLLSNTGPHNTYSGDFTSLAVDSSTGRLYAVWAYQKSAEGDAVGVWTRDIGGQWVGPTDVMSGGSLGDQLSIVAGNGKAFASFISSRVPGNCDDATTRSGDVAVVTYDGNTWSSPQNLTSCVSDPSILEFSNPKLALDENGRAYLVSSANGDLWYNENAAGTWSDPAQITHLATIPDSVGTALRTFYGIAGSAGVAYVTYVRQSGPSTYDVLLMTHPLGGSWDAPQQVSPQDPSGCPKFGVSIVASSGRVGLSYVRGHTGYCKSGGAGINVPFLFVGVPGQMRAVGSLVASNANCTATSLAHEANYLRFIASCVTNGDASGNARLFYKAEFLDTVGPVAHLFAQSHSSSSIQLHWTARDPKPGSGVAAYELQVQGSGNSWKTLLGSTHAKAYTYRNAQSGRRYTFRLRSKDRVGNWGAWVTASTRAIS